MLVKDLITEAYEKDNATLIIINNRTYHLNRVPLALLNLNVRELDIAIK
jgi:hypothetical protein